MQLKNILDICADNEIEKFADKVRLLMTNHDILYKMEKQALVSASKFNMDNTIKQWEKILQRELVI